jgi:RNA polymerase sigma-70 factor (ECF subfamily)
MATKREPKTTFLAGEAVDEPSGSNERQGALFARVGERIYRYFYKTVWNPEEAEELAHRTIAELLASVREKRYDRSKSFNAWLWIKAHTVFVDWCRERDRKLRELGSRVASPSEAETVDRRLDAASLLKAVQTELGAETYEIFLLRHEGGLTLDEVAEATSRNRRTVTKRLEEAQELIRRRLELRGEAS